MKTFLLTLVLSILSCLSYAQTKPVEVSGKILDHTGNPASAITVELVDSTNPKLHYYDVTDNKGEYIFHQVERGTYSLLATPVGQETLSQAVEVSGETATLTLKPISLRSTTKNLEGIEVVGAKKPVVEVKPDKTVFNVANSPTSTGLSGLELLRKSPGVSIDNNNNIQLKGVGGVRVFIDGKPTYMGGDQLTQFLSSLSAENIDKIELISSPSAKYEAEGTGGIVNIILKKGKKVKGINGAVTADLGWLTYTGKYRGNYNANVNYMNNKTAIHASYGLSHGESYFRFGSDRTQEGNTYIEKVIQDQNRLSHNANVSVDQELDKTNSISAGVRLNFSDEDAFSNAYSDIYTGVSPSAIYQKSLYNPSPRNNNDKQIVPSVTYTHKDEKIGELSIATDYSYYKSKSENTLNDMYFSEPSRTNQISSNRYQQLADATFNIFAIKADWSKQLKTIKIEGGLKFSAANTENIFKQSSISNNVASLDTTKSTAFEYQENIYAAYLQIQVPIKKFTFSLGLRDEYTETDGISKHILTFAQKADNKRSYNDIFPSLGIAYNPSMAHALSFQYSRRILRPSYQELNPFEFQQSALSYESGNPNLVPQYVNKVELSYTLFHMTTISTSYTHIDDVIYPFIEKKADGASTFLPRNIGKSSVFGVSLSSPFTLMKLKKAPFWTGFANLNYMQSNNSGYYNGKDYSISFPQLNGYVEMSFRASSTLSFQLSSWFVSASVWSASVEHNAFGTLDFAVQNGFFNKKLNVKLYWRDIFQTAHIEFSNSQTGVQLTNGMVRFPYPTAGINVSYNFGSNNNAQQQGRSKKKSAFEEEDQRMKGGGGFGGAS